MRNLAQFGGTSLRPLTVTLTLISFSLLALLIVGSNFGRSEIGVAVLLVVFSILFGLVSGYIVFGVEKERDQSQSTPD